MKKLIFILLLFLAFGVFFKYGSAVYTPIFHKIKGEETIASINQKLESKVYKTLYPALKQAGFDTFPPKIKIVALKSEQEVEVYAASDSIWKLLKTYSFTAFSGTIGPKLKAGDKQIPEGIYKIEYLNPNSAYYLSLKINYPNDFDRQKAKLEQRNNLGGDIFIHGKEVTIGCIPIGDEAIEELFILAAKSYKNGIKVIISPIDFRKNNNFPKIDNIEWENELYQNIATELKQL